MRSHTFMLVLAAIVSTITVPANSNSLSATEMYEASAPYALEPLSPPANFRITGGNSSSRSFEWDAVPGASGYYFHVYVGTSLIAKFPLSGTSYHFGSASGTFTMFVKAFDSTGESAASNSITTTLFG